MNKKLFKIFSVGLLSYYINILWYFIIWFEKHTWMYGAYVKWSLCTPKLNFVVWKVRRQRKKLWMCWMLMLSWNFHGQTKLVSKSHCKMKNEWKMKTEKRQLLELLLMVSCTVRCTTGNAWRHQTSINHCDLCVLCVFF